MEKKEKLNKNEEKEIKKDVVNNIKEKVLMELNKEINTIIVDSTTKFKEDLKEEISSDIQIEVTNVMKQEERRILKGKNSAIFKRDFIIILLFALILYFGYCLYDIKYFDFMKSECERNGTCTINSDYTTDTENPSKPPEIVKDKKWYIENYGYLLNEVKVNMNADNAKSYYLYSSDHSLSDIKTNYLLNIAYSHLDKKEIKTNSTTIAIEADSLKNAFINVFGTESLYQNVNFSYNCLEFTYNQEKNRYTAENNKCSDTKNIIVEEIDDMLEEGDVLYIKTIAAIYNESEKSFYTFDDLYDSAVSNVTKEDMSKYVKKLNRYQYQFKKVDNVYYLDSITKLK